MKVIAITIAILLGLLALIAFFLKEILLAAGA